MNSWDQDQEFSLEDILSEIRQKEEPKKAAPRWEEEVAFTQTLTPAGREDQKHRPARNNAPEEPQAETPKRDTLLEPSASTGGNLPLQEKEIPDGEPIWGVEPEQEPARELEEPGPVRDDFSLHEGAKTKRVDGGKTSEQGFSSLQQQEKEYFDRASFQELKQNRKKRIKDFVLVGEEEENDPEEEPEQEEPVEEIDDLRSREDIPSVAQDLKELKGSLTLRLVILLVTTSLSLGLFLFNLLLPGALPGFLNPREEPLGFLSAQLLLLLFGGAFSYTTVTGGLSSLFRLRAERDALPAVATVVCVIQTAVLMLFPEGMSERNVHAYAPLALLGLLFNTIGKLMIAGRTATNFKMVSSDYHQYGCHLVEDEGEAAAYTRGLLNDAPVLAVSQKTHFLKDFLSYSYGEDLSDRLSRLLAPISLAGGAVLAAVVQVMMNDLLATLTIFTATVCLCSPLGFLFAVNQPLRQVSKRLSRRGAAVLGYRAADEYSDLNCAMVSAKDLFPQGSVTLYGIKTFSGMRIDEAILDAASVACQAGSILSDVFVQILAGKTDLLQEVDNLLYEDGMGISGWVENKRVLIGNRELMLNHGVDVPSRDYETRYLDEGRELVYLSTGGDLTAVFIIGLSADPQVRLALHKQEQNDIFLVVKSVDPILTQDKLATLFDAEKLMFKLMPGRLYESYQRETAEQDAISSPVAHNGTFLSYITALVEAKRLKSSAMIGMFLQFASILVGYGLLSIFGVLKDLSQITTVALAAYQVIWAVFSWIVMKIRG